MIYLLGILWLVCAIFSAVLFATFFMTDKYLAHKIRDEIAFISIFVVILMVIVFFIVIFKLM